MPAAAKPGKFVTIGALPCPSGTLLVVDAGTPALWPGPPDPDWGDGKVSEPADLVDIDIVGADNYLAVRTATERSPYGDFFPLSRQPGVVLYDVKREAAAKLDAAFSAFCAEEGLDARIDVLAEKVPIAERARRAVRYGNSGRFRLAVPGGSVDVRAVSAFPTDRPLDIVVMRNLRKGSLMSMTVADPAVETPRYASGRAKGGQHGSVAVDGGAILIGDVHALSELDPHRSVDGLVDIEVRIRGPRPPVDPAPVLGRDRFGWLGVEPEQADRHQAELLRWREAHPETRIGISREPHSPVWQMNQAIDASPWRAGVVEIAGGGVLIFETGVGDGSFPVTVGQARDLSGIALTVDIA